MLNIQNLQLAFGKNKVLKGIDLSLEANAIHGIIGLNGSGKTTMLNCLYGNLKPQSGTMLWQNSPIQSQQIGFLETHHFFYPRMTGYEYLRFFQVAQQDFDLEGWNSVFQLPLKKFVTSYSTGMKKKLAIMGIMSLNRPIVILDEPFNGLDLETNEVIKRIVQLLKKRGKTVLITSHILETLTSICDEIHYLNQGMIANSFEPNTYHELSAVFANLEFEQLDTLVR